MVLVREEEDVTPTPMEANKARLEAALDDAIANYTEVKQRLSSLQAQRNLGKSSAATLSRLGEQLQQASREVERRRASLASLEEEIRRSRFERDASRARQLQETDDALRVQLESVRAEILHSLVGLADLFRLHAQLAERKDRAARELSHATGKDCKYANYIDCAILRKADFEGDLEYVVETVKRLRVVA